MSQPILADILVTHIKIDLVRPGPKMCWPIAGWFDPARIDNSNHNTSTSKKSCV